MSTSRKHVVAFRKRLKGVVSRSWKKFKIHRTTTKFHESLGWSLHQNIFLCLHVKLSLSRPQFAPTRLLSPPLPFFDQRSMEQLLACRPGPDEWITGKVRGIMVRVCVGGAGRVQFSSYPANVLPCSVCIFSERNKSRCILHR